ncbi:MAG: helix-loop-helix DNA-binding domain-containing protein [Linnemannia elongata]|nr:MAG: helix-loop-helix DNA-binding domain-containing protein [Linnemannia elongata]
MTQGCIIGPQTEGISLAHSSNAAANERASALLCYRIVRGREAKAQGKKQTTDQLPPLFFSFLVCFFDWIVTRCFSRGNNRALLMNEKRRRRRESHNAVERRRRDNINEKIQELSTLLPEIYVDSANKPNKGVILRKSVDYIRHLQQLVTSQNNRNQELEAQLRARNGAGSTGDESNANGVNGAGPGPQLQQDFGMMRIVSGGGNGGQN